MTPQPVDQFKTRVPSFHLPESLNCSSFEINTHHLSILLCSQYPNHNPNRSCTHCKWIFHNRLLSERESAIRLFLAFCPHHNHILVKQGSVYIHELHFFPVLPCQWSELSLPSLTCENVLNREVFSPHSEVRTQNDFQLRRQEKTGKHRINSKKEEKTENDFLSSFPVFARVCVLHVFPYRNVFLTISRRCSLGILLLLSHVVTLHFPLDIPFFFFFFFFMYRESESDGVDGIKFKHELFRRVLLVESGSLVVYEKPERIFCVVVSAGGWVVYV